MARRLRTVALAALVVIVGAAVPSVARAEAVPEVLATIRQVDTREPAVSKLTFVYGGSLDDVAGATLTENGTTVEAAEPAPLPVDTTVGVALVFDTSTAMDADGALVAAKDAARRWILGRSPAAQEQTEFAVIVASDRAVLLQDFTADEERLLLALDRVGPPETEAAAGETALWGAVQLAGELLADAEPDQRNVVVMTAQGDTVGGSASAARGAVTSAAAMVFAVGYAGRGLDAGGLKSLTQLTGGQLRTSGDPTAVGDEVDEVAGTLSEGQFVLEYPSTVPTGEVADLRLSVGGQEATASVVVGSAIAGKPALNPQVAGSSGSIDLLPSWLVLAVGVVLALVAAAGLAYAVIMIFTRDDELTTVLQTYADPYGGTYELEDESPTQSFARTALVQRAVEITEQVAAERGLLVRTESALERANLPLRAGEALFFYGALVIVVTVLGLVLTGSLLGGLIIGLVAAAVPIAVVNFLAGRRKKQFQSQLPDTLQLLSGTLRAGYSLMQGVEAVSQEVAEPMGQELRRVVTESRLGRPLEEALQGTADRMDSPDFAWAVMAIRIQREVGGNLSELLLTVAETMTARERLRRDVAALTAEGRVSAIVLGILPVALGGIMFVLNPDYTGQLIKTTIGNVMLGLAVVSMVIGFFWMKKIIDIEI